METKCAVLMELQDPHFFQSLSNPLRLTDQKFLISAVNGKKKKKKKKTFSLLAINST